MTKIQINVDEMMRIANEMSREVVFIGDNLEKQSKIISDLDWNGPDYEIFSEKWNTFSKREDKKMKDQYEQYTKYLFGFHSAVIDTRDKILKIASKLPQ